MKSIERSLGRRNFLKGAALASAGVAMGHLPLAASLTTGRTARGEPRPRTPSDALQRLLDGNRRFVAGESAGLHRDMVRIQEVAGGQIPYAAVLSCADSRVPPELLFDQGFGDIFTVRVAGNVAGTEEVASLEYSVAVLGSQVLMVLGHTACGAVEAAMDGGSVPGRISALYSHIQPAIRGAGKDVDAAVEANVRHQVAVIRDSSPVMREAVAADRLLVVGGVYDLATGRVTVVGEG